MTLSLIALSLAVAPAEAQEATVTPLVALELAGTGGREGSMVMVEYAPRGLTRRTGTMLMRLFTCWKGQ
jgi:hypothetical protein